MELFTCPDLASVLLPHGYAMVVVDMRGSGLSTGWKSDNMPQICDDGKAVVDWIAQQPWCDGNIGMAGGSYLGWSQICTASRKPEALKCIIPDVVPFEGFSEEPYPGGIFSYAAIYLWSAQQHLLDRNLIPSVPVLDEDGDGDLLDEIPVLDANGNGIFWDEYPWPVDPANPPQYPDNSPRTEHHYFNATMAHISTPHGDSHFGNYDYFSYARKAFFINSSPPFDPGITAYDLSVNLVPGLMDSKIPVYNFGGWFDTFARGTCQFYATLQGTNPSRLKMGPEYHGGLNPGFAGLTGMDPDVYQKQMNTEAMRWFDRWLKGIDNGIDTEPPVLIYVVNGDGWRQETEWPLARQKTVTLYLEEGNTFALSPPAQGSDQYTADYSHHALTETLDVGWLKNVYPAPVSDLFYIDRFLSSSGADPQGLPLRTETGKTCLAYTTPPLGADAEMTGHPVIQIWISSTADYGDFYFFLEDVDETGEAVLVTRSILRAGMPI